MANAETQQKLLDYYSNASAEMQQKMYNAGNTEVKAMIDAYNNQNATNTPNTQTETPTTEVPTDRNGGVGGNGRPDQKGELVPETYNYYSNDTQAAQDTIVNNLNNYWKNSPNLFTNYENFKNNFSYDARSNQQKKTLDDWRFGYDNSRQLSTRSTGDLTTLYKNGQLTDADLNNLRYFYPDKYNDVMNKINGQNDMQQYSEMLYGPEDTLDTSNVFNQLGNQFLNNLLTNGYSSSIDYFEQYQNELNTDEMRGWSDRLTDLQTEIDKIDTDLNTLYKDIEKRYEGTGASTAKIQAVYADEAYDLQIQRNSLALEQQSLATKYNSRLQEAQQNFSMRVQQHQLEMQERNQYMNELGFAMDLINFETNEEADERVWKNWTRQIDYQYGNINSMDETARRKAVDNSVSEILKQYEGIPIKRSKDQIIDDVLSLVDSGMSLGDALTQNLVQQIQSKPEYITWYNSKLGVNSPVQYQMDANGNLSLVGGTATVPIGTTGNNYQSIDLGNGYSVKVDGNKPITINGQQYRITQLGGETATSGIDFAPATRGDNQEVQAFVGGKVIRSGTDKSTGNRYVEILGDNGYVYRYNHLNDWDTSYASGAGASPYQGQRVEAGTVIGHMGETGKASGVHLDLAVYDGRRATDTSVSPLNIVDQAKVFFSSVNAQGLGIGSNGASTVAGEMTFEQKQVYEAAKSAYNKAATYWKSDEGKKTAAFIEEAVLNNWTVDQITDSLRKLAEDPNLQTNMAVNSAMQKIFSASSSRDQTKTYNFKELLEDELANGQYTNVLEDIFSAARADKDIMVSDDAKMITNLQQVTSDLADIQQLYEEYRAAGGGDWLIKGKWNDFKTKGLKLSGDDDLAKIANRLNYAVNQFSKRMSGLTVSDKERQMYKDLFPSTKQSAEAFFNNLQVFYDNAETNISTIYGLALGTDRYEDLMNWYKETTGNSYSFVNTFNRNVYRTSNKIDLPSNNQTNNVNTGGLTDDEWNYILDYNQ